MRVPSLLLLSLLTHSLPLSTDGLSPPPYLQRGSAANRRKYERAATVREEGEDEKSKKGQLRAREVKLQPQLNTAAAAGVKFVKQKAGIEKASQRNKK